MEKRKLVLTIIGVVILAMVIMVYIYFSKPGRDEKKNQQIINQVQTVQQKTDEKKENTEITHIFLRKEINILFNNGFYTITTRCKFNNFGFVKFGPEKFM